MEPDISIVCDSNKFHTVAVKEHQTLSSKSFHRAAVKWITLPKIRSILTQVFGSIGIVDPARERTTVYRYEEDVAPVIIPFHDTLKLKNI